MKDQLFGGLNATQALGTPGDEWRRAKRGFGGRVWRQRRARRGRRMTLGTGDFLESAMAFLSANSTRKASWYRGERLGYCIGFKTQRGMFLRQINASGMSSEAPLRKRAGRRRQSAWRKG